MSVGCLQQSAILRQAAPDLHSLTESPPYHFVSDQPQLVTSNPTDFLLCLPQKQSCGYFIGPRQDWLASPHYSRGFVTKPPRRQTRRARGAARKGGILEQDVDRPSGVPARRQACRSGVSAVAVEAFVNNAGGYINMPKGANRLYAKTHSWRRSAVGKMGTGSRAFLGCLSPFSPRYFLDMLVPLVAVFVALFLGIGGSGPLGFGLFVAYVIWAFVLFARGTTPGKNFLGIRVVKEDGISAGFWTMLIREWIGKTISGLIFALGFIWILFDRDNQGWHDKLMRTYVVGENMEVAPK